MRHPTALAKLADIFNEKTGGIPRVNNPTHEKSTHPTAPAIINTASRVHQRTTRANNPGMLPLSSRMINLPKSRVRTPPTQPAEERSNPPEWYEPPRDKRARKRVITAPKGKRKFTTHLAIHKHVQATIIAKTTPSKFGQMGTPQQPAVIEDKPKRKTYKPLPKFQNSRMILQEAFMAFTATVCGMSPEHLLPQSMRLDEDKINKAIELEHFCAPVVHPVSRETISKYQTLAKNPVTKETWTTAWGKEWGHLAQGDETKNTAETDSLFVITHKEILNIPKDRTVTYAQMVVNYCPQKPDPNRVRITAGGNIIKYPGKITTGTADLTTSKIMWNSVLSTKDTKYMCIDIKNFYLGTPLD